MNGGKLIITTEVDNRTFNRQIKATQKEYEALYDKMSNMKASGVKETEKQFIDLGAQIERTTNKLETLRKKSMNISLGKIRNIQYNESAFAGKQLALVGSYTGSGSVRDIKGDLYTVADTYKDIHAKITESSEETKKLTNETNKLGATNTKVFEKGVKTLKRFALGIIGIRSAYTMARRAASAYMAQDEELSNKVRSFWIGLGSFLAPILEMLSDVMLKALGYLNVFIKALTGIDYIARANAKALKKQADATKEATKALSSLDEIENIDLGSKMDEKSLADFGYIDIPELDPKVVKKLEEMAGWLKENWDWIQKVGEVLLLVFAGSVAKSILKGIGKLIGSEALTTGLAGMKGLLVGMAVVWTITLVVKGLEMLDKWRKAYKELIEAQKNQTKKLTGNQTDIMRRTQSMIDNGTLTKESFADIARAVNESIKQNENWIKSGELTEEQELALANSNEYLRKYMVSLRTEGYLTDDMWELYTKQINLTSVEYGKLAKQSQLTEDEFNGLKQAVINGAVALDDITNEDYRIKIKTEMDNEAINKLLGTIEALETASQSGGWISQFTNKAKLLLAKFQLQRLRGYAYGGLVTQPTQALIGEAGYNEYILPEKSNYLSRLASNIIENMPQGAGMSDDLLLELNRNITELANRPIILNVDGKALAQATYQDFKNEENRLNSSTSVSIK